VFQLYNTGAAGVAASPRLPASRRLASGDIGLHPFDVAEVEAADEPSTRQRLDVSLNPTPVHLQRRCLDRSTMAAEDRAGFRFLQIPVAHFADRHAGAYRMAPGGRIFAPGDAGQLLADEVTRILRRQSPVLTEHEQPGPPLDVPILDEKGPHAGRLHPDPKASQLAVPDEHVSTAH
jgi:hypothetical protein